MSEKSDVKGFPDISSKLAAPPPKKSLFERQKAEAEAKKAREEAETAAIYEDFVKSFDDDGASPETVAQSGSRPPLTSSTGGAGKRHFAGLNAKGAHSGPGSLGPSPSARSGPGSLGQTSTFGRKRTYEDAEPQRRSGRHGMFAFEDSPREPSPLDTASRFKSHDDDERNADSRAEDRAAAKPTLHLSSLPPGTSVAVIKALIPPVLTVDTVRILPSQQPQNTSSIERKSSSAIVTLAKETPATDIDTAVNSLQNKYLGMGYNLSISRHLSSAAIGVNMPMSSGLGSALGQPFGARPIPQTTSLNRAPPPGHGHRGGFAPPTSYNPSSYGRHGQQPLQVSVQQPGDLKELRLIHKTLEALLTYGPEFEALLMSRQDVQKDPKWAWLWNARSTGGVYYRWRLWEILTDSPNKTQRHRGRYGGPVTQQVFENHAPWAPPEFDLKFEYITDLPEIVSNSDYDSSDEEDDDPERRRQFNGPGDAVLELNADIVADGMGYLSPLGKAKLIHLLERLPTSNTKLRKGDIARVTAFAIEHAGAGADEVVDILTANILRPMACSTPENENEENNERAIDGESAEDDLILHDQSKKDTSSASMISLYLVSDILSSSSTSGVRHAWRYRSLFEVALRSYLVFETLGRLDRSLGWGRLKAEKWKRSVQSLLSLWEGWCVFPQDSQDHFSNIFANPPLTEKEKELQAKEERRREREEEENKKARSRWKAIEEEDATAAAEDEEMEDVDGMPLDDADLDGEVLTDENLDGEPMVDSSDEEETTRGDVEMAGVESKAQVEDPVVIEEGQKRAVHRIQRPTAMDMFGDSDNSDSA
ncbi:MAG: hypothetical protein Q9160_005266 [Pyrenula sp. 1 TL-2023]